MKRITYFTIIILGLIITFFCDCNGNVEQLQKDNQRLQEQHRNDSIEKVDRNSLFSQNIELSNKLREKELELQGEINKNAIDKDKLRDILIEMNDLLDELKKLDNRYSKYANADEFKEIFAALKNTILTYQSIGRRCSDLSIENDSLKNALSNFHIDTTSTEFVNIIKNHPYFKDLEEKLRKAEERADNAEQRARNAQHQAEEAQHQAEEAQRQAKEAKEDRKKDSLKWINNVISSISLFTETDKKLKKQIQFKIKFDINYQYFTRNECTIYFRVREKETNFLITQNENNDFKYYKGERLIYTHKESFSIRRLGNSNIDKGRVTKYIPLPPKYKLKPISYEIDAYIIFEEDKGAKDVGRATFTLHDDDNSEK